MMVSPALLTLSCLTLTVGAYLIGVAVQRRVGWAVANPVLLAIVLVGVVLRLTHVDYAAYFAGAQFIHFLLGPATVALAIPLVRALEHIRRGWRAMMVALVTGSVVAMVSGYALVRMLGGSRIVALSMLPKSLTTPIAIGVAETIGGVPSLTAVLAIASGILVAVAIDWVVRRAEPAARGMAAGMAGSGLGAARVIPEGAVAAAFAGVAIGLNGLVTALLAPACAALLRRW